MKCSMCGDKKCEERGNEYNPRREEYIEKYKTTNRKLIESSYEVTSETKAKADRIEELILFAKKMSYKKLGLLFVKVLQKKPKT